MSEKNEIQNKKPFAFPIVIRVGYEWGEENEGPARWAFMRDSLKRIANEVKTASAKTANKGQYPFNCRISRMRGCHGSDLLGRLIQRCEEADILIFDITQNNPNVLFELGVAIASKRPDSGNVFVFQEVKEKGKKLEPVSKLPSDLNGLFFTRYKAQPRGGYKLEDAQGFRAALKSRLMDVARERGMWRDASAVDVDDD